MKPFSKAIFLISFIIPFYSGDVTKTNRNRTRAYHSEFNAGLASILNPSCGARWSLIRAFKWTLKTSKNEQKKN